MSRKQLSPPRLIWLTRNLGQPHIKESGKITKIMIRQSNVKELNWNKKSFKKNNVKKFEIAKIHSTNSRSTECDRDKKLFKIKRT